jgi:hypothetical protein
MKIKKVKVIDSIARKNDRNNKIFLWIFAIWVGFGILKMYEAARQWTP